VAGARKRQEKCKSLKIFPERFRVRQRVSDLRLASIFLSA